jgi:hypothetical protein
MRPLLKARLTVDHEDAGPGKPAKPLYCHLMLYKEENGLTWRINGELGDICETLPKPATVDAAKADFREVYMKHGFWNPKASWL